MVRHSGGKIGRAAKKLASKSTSKKSKSISGKILKKHQDKHH